MRKSEIIDLMESELERLNKRLAVIASDLKRLHRDFGVPLPPPPNDSFPPSFTKDVREMMTELHTLKNLIETTGTYIESLKRWGRNR